MVGISQAESNNIKACSLPSIHLPLTREARVLVIFVGWCGCENILVHTDISIAKSEGDSAVLKGWGGANCVRNCECLEVLKMVLLLISIPSVLTADRLSNYKSRIYPIKTL